jgi:hypothetical protein
VVVIASLVPAQAVRADGCDVSAGVVQEGDVITGTPSSDTTARDRITGTGCWGSAETTF